MPDVQLEPFFQRAFPGYRIQQAPVSTVEACLSISGQVQPGYYQCDTAPPLNYAIQHILLNDAGQHIGAFEEPHLRHPQTTMNLHIVHRPHDKLELEPFCLLILSTLLNQLKYKPSKAHPLIVRGKDIAFIDQLQLVAQVLGFSAEVFSNRSIFTPHFFKPSQGNTPPKRFTPDPAFAAFAEPFISYWASRRFIPEDRPALTQQLQAARYG